MVTSKGPLSSDEPQPMAEAEESHPGKRAAPAPPERVEEPTSLAEPESAEGEELDAGAALESELAQVRSEAAEYLDGWQRARAELSNARKRFQREQAQAYSSAAATVLTRLLPVVDDFERAFAVPEDERELEAWVNGMALIYRTLQQLLEQEGVARIPAAGSSFDPHVHQAITHEPSDSVPEGTVIGEVRAGYQMGDRVLRPALVRVSAGPPAAQELVADEPVPEAEE